MTKKILFMMVGVLGLSACQSLPTPTTAQSMPAIHSDRMDFEITGKIGITTQTPEGKNAGSAFYVWKQKEERFVINLTGVLGMGATQIEYDGQTATLMTDKGQLTAHSPNELLFKATGWHAPIDTLPYWVMGRTTQADTDSVFHEGKLTQSRHGDWQASFDYKGALPHRITMIHKAGHKAVITINHGKP